MSTSNVQVVFVTGWTSREIQKFNQKNRGKKIAIPSGHYYVCEGEEGC